MCPIEEALSKRLHACFSLSINPSSNSDFETLNTEAQLHHEHCVRQEAYMLLFLQITNRSVNKSPRRPKNPSYSLKESYSHFKSSETADIRTPLKQPVGPYWRSNWGFWQDVPHTSPCSPPWSNWRRAPFPDTEIADGDDSWLQTRKRQWRHVSDWMRRRLSLKSNACSEPCVCIPVLYNVKFAVKIKGISYYQT